MIVLSLGCTVIACSRERGDKPPPPQQPRWWCWPTSVCFAERRVCEEAARHVDTKPPCVARSTAVCRRGCEAPATPGGQPSCSPKCAVDREACELFKTAQPCHNERPPEHPELFDYSTPGFWCYSFERGAAGPGSWCTKEKDECEWILDDTLRQMGGTREALGSAGAIKGCSVAMAPVYCWSRRVDGRIALVCTLSKAFCEETRGPTVPVPAGHTVTDITPCEQWIDR